MAIKGMYKDKNGDEECFLDMRDCGEYIYVYVIIKNVLNTFELVAFTINKKTGIISLKSDIHNNLGLDLDSLGRLKVEGQEEYKKVEESKIGSCNAPLCSYCRLFDKCPSCTFHENFKPKDLYEKVEQWDNSKN